MSNKVKRAINALKRSHPWIGHMAEAMPKHYGDTLPTGQPNPTMATNGKLIAINEQFLDELSHAETCGVIAHEIIHVVQRHPLRRGNRDPERWGVAIDAATNHIVVNELHLRLPADRVREINDSVDNIYSWRNHLALQPQPQHGEGEGEGEDEGQGESQGQGEGEDEGQGQGESQGEGEGEGEGESQGQGNGNSEQGSDKPAPMMGDDCHDYPLEPGQTLADADREIDQMIAEAQLQAAMAGTSVSRQEIKAFELADTELNWPNELQDYVHLIGGADYSMNPPHVGLSQQGIICNQLNPTGCGNVVIAVDTSGSIDRNKLNLALTHLTLFVENMDYESLRVIACNRRVTFDRTFYRGESPDISEMRTGGGTAFQPVFDLIEEGAAPDLFLYFTDMLCRDLPPDFEPDYPVIWLVDLDDDLVKDGDWNPDSAYVRRGYAYTPHYGKIIDTRQ